MENYEECKSRLRDTLQKVESCSAEEGRAVLDAFVKDYETSIYNEIGRLTRHLHDSLASFQADEKICSLTKEEIPSAKERLKYVMDITERAAQKVLEFIEMSIPLSLKIKEGAGELSSLLERNKEMYAVRSVEENTRIFLKDATKNADILHGHLTEILMAQEYQDISGQIIKKVIDLVQEVESNLLRIIKITGSAE